MADNFDFAFRWMAPHEYNARRNFTNDPDDPGGATKWGITLSSLQKAGSLWDLDHDGDVDVSDLQLMTEEQAKEFYREHYWIFDGISDARLAAKLFDIGVNLGPDTAVGYLQRGLLALGWSLDVDRRLGPKTLAAANSESADRIMLQIVRSQAAHYDAWIRLNTRREKYRDGLEARAVAVPTIAQAASA